MLEINIANDFTRLPGPRYRHQGPGSGQQFLTDHLRPMFESARASNEKVTIKLDGVRYGYPTSFLEEAFGGLAREFGSGEVLKYLRFESVTEPMLGEEIRYYIERANDIPGAD